MNETIEFEPLAGTHINHAAADAIAQAGVAGAPVVILFQGLRIPVQADDTVDAVYARWREATAAEAAKPENIERARQSKARVDALIADAQARLDEVMAQVRTMTPLDVADPRWTATWIGSFADAAEWVGVCWEPQRVVELLASAGYRTNAFTASDPDPVALDRALTRQQPNRDDDPRPLTERLRAHLETHPLDLYRYLIGQAMDGMSSRGAIRGVYLTMLERAHETYRGTAGAS